MLRHRIQVFFNRITHWKGDFGKVSLCSSLDCSPSVTNEWEDQRIQGQVLVNLCALGLNPHRTWDVLNLSWLHTKPMRDYFLFLFNDSLSAQSTPYLLRPFQISDSWWFVNKKPNDRSLFLGHQKYNSYSSKHSSTSLVMLYNNCLHINQESTQQLFSVLDLLFVKVLPYF